MVKSITAHKENLRQLLVVVGHHARPRRLLGHREQVVDVLDGAEGLLPELELDGRVQLREARVEVALERVRVLEVDRVRLVRVLGHVRQVQAQSLAQAAELDLALVLQAERERLLRDVLRMNSLGYDIVSE